ncbi:MAG: hypothetical protein RL223_4925 [Pseudomonadota bacterium]
MPSTEPSGCSLPCDAGAPAPASAAGSIRRRAGLFGALSLLALAAAPVQAQNADFPPKKTVTIVVGFAAGGAADMAARVIGKKLGDNLGATWRTSTSPRDRPTAACCSSARSGRWPSRRT